MKIFRIVRFNGRYRVDQLHHILFIFKYWDIGAFDLCPNYLYDTLDGAIKAIRNKIGDDATIYIKVEKFIYCD